MSDIDKEQIINGLARMIRESDACMVKREKTLGDQLPARMSDFDGLRHRRSTGHITVTLNLYAKAWADPSTYTTAKDCPMPTDGDTMTEPRFYIQRGCTCIGVIDRVLAAGKIYSDHSHPCYVWHQEAKICPTCERHWKVTTAQTDEAERVCAELNSSFSSPAASPPPSPRRPVDTPG